MVYGVLRLINFAHGDIYMLGAFAGYYTARFLGFGESLSMEEVLILLAAAMIFSALAGAIIERIAYRPLRRAPRLTALITAIGVSLFLEYGGQLVFGTDPKPFPQLGDPKHNALITFGQTVVGKQEMITFVVAIVLLLALQVIVYRTRAGKAMRAVSFDRETASLMGINTDRIILLTFMIGSAFAGAAGVLVAMQEPSLTPMMGLLRGIKAFTAAVLGGIGSVPGAMVGGIAIGLTESLVSGYWTSSYRDAVVFGVLIFMLLVRPSGLFGRGNVEKV